MDYTIDFNFTTSDQRAELNYLQTNNYSLIGFKGAEGPQQITVGVPAWFSIPFGNIFGTTTITYRPEYKVYVFNQGQIAAQTTIQMQTLSNPVPLGSALTFQQTGAFASGGVANVPGDSIGVLNGTSSTTPTVTVGLAGLVNTAVGWQYLPFCAFTFPPAASIIMRPIEQVLLVAAQLNLTSGNVQANLTGPGAQFIFSAQTPDYPLMIQQNTNAITGVPGGPPVNLVPSGTNVSIVNGAQNQTKSLVSGKREPAQDLALTAGVISR